MTSTRNRSARARTVDFSERLHVHELGYTPIRYVFLVAFALLSFFAALMVASVLLATGSVWPGMVAVIPCMGMTFYGFLAGLLYANDWHQAWRRWRGVADFDARQALVTLDDDGVSIEGLGLIGWRDVQPLEGDPKARYVMLCTALFPDLVLRVPRARVKRAWRRRKDDRPSQLPFATPPEPTAATSFDARIVPRSPFRARLARGVVLGLLAAFAMFHHLHDQDRGVAVTRLGAAAVGLAVAGVAWFVAWWRLRRALRAPVSRFTLTPQGLSSPGRFPVDLDGAVAWWRRTSGPGRPVDILAIRPRRGPRLDLAVDTGDLDRLLPVWRARPGVDHRDRR